MSNLLIIVTERDRKDQEYYFKKYMTDFLNERKIKFTIVIVHQVNRNLFNKGTLYNIGYLFSKDSKNNIKADYIIFHDIDLLPDSNVDYSFNDNFQLMVSTISHQGEIHVADFTGGSVKIGLSLFEEINGFSNLYEGWGAEDDELVRRVTDRGIVPERLNGKYNALKHQIDKNICYKNRHLLNSIKPSDGLKQLVNVKNNYIPLQNAIKQKPYTMSSYKDAEYANIYHVHADFASQYTEVIPNKINYIGEKIRNKINITVCFLNGTIKLYKNIVKILNKMFPGITIARTMNCKYESDILIDSNSPGISKKNDFEKNGVYINVNNKCFKILIKKDQDYFNALNNNYDLVLHLNDLDLV